MITLKKLKEANQALERLTQVNQDLKALKILWGLPTLRVVLIHDPADFNRGPTACDLAYRPDVSRYIELLKNDKVALETILQEAGIEIPM